MLEQPAVKQQVKFSSYYWNSEDSSKVPLVGPSALKCEGCLKQEGRNHIKSKCGCTVLFLVGHLCTYITTAGCNPIKQGVYILIDVRSFLLSLSHILLVVIGMQYVLLLKWLLDLSSISIFAQRILLMIWKQRFYSWVPTLRIRLYHLASLVTQGRSLPTWWIWRPCIPVRL